MTDNDELNDEAWDNPEAGEEAEADGVSTTGEVSHAELGVPTPGEDRPRRKKRDDYVTTDERANQALKFVSDVIREMEMECTVHLRRPQEGNAEDEINIEIAGRDAGRIIGKKGQVLQALQFLTHRIINRPALERRHILVDAEGYRSRRDNSLATMAQRLGRQAVEEGKIITFEPMNPRDRRVVHLALAKFEGVITRSDGEGDDRRVQIIPVRRNTGAAGANAS
ncbi:MAG TPA: R3H domain-containing nucleic acid-binding protein [Polyangiaceae bacterium]|jgi:spoIIIJ-associated protein